MKEFLNNTDVSHQENIINYIYDKYKNNFVLLLKLK